MPGEYSSCEQMTMSENMKALLVIDVQKTYISKYEANIVQKINERIIEVQKNRYDIVYIKNTKKLRSGMVTDEFADELILASDNVFCKMQADAFSSEELVSYLNAKSISEIEMMGVDGNSCIKASAKGAVKCGFLVSILLSCVGVSNLPRFEKTKEDLEKIGVRLE